MKKYFRKNKKKFLIIILLVAALLAGIFFVRNRGSKNNSDEEAKTTSALPTAQSDFTDGTDRQPAKTNRNEGTVTDNGGNVGSIPSSNNWTVSNSKQITLYSPSKGSLVKSGDKITGASSLSNVYFRLIDDVSGVIAQGQLNVVSGKFSGKFNFSTSGNEGRLDVFSITDDGVEFSNIEVPIQFR